MIYSDIKSFNKQFAWDRHIENARALKKFRNYIVIGMGGSHFAADLIKTWRPDFPVVVWSNYGLPPLARKGLKKSLVIATSYSGNTEETIDALELALKRKLNIAVIASGGKLIAMARKFGIPYVLVPSGIQPRAALGYLLVATLTVMGEKRALRGLRELAGTLRPGRYEQQGKSLARRLRRSVPVIYASPRNYSVAYNWKIRLNETGKIPAFYHLVPEMNHNEMIGFDVNRSTVSLSRRFHFIFLEDPDDDPRILKRMRVTRKLFAGRGFRSDAVPLRGRNVWEKVFSSIVLADWASYHVARQYHSEPEAVAMIEKFKKLIAKQ
ncbi:bifunctional phosphoglucose/phosphomannose isomerase [Candidatus Parcubacteria bacterium]|nr:MAG: bifunctional phosphoglucose/phosphomannose isomerase [Candidatus Parcubacteria bacterium]